jgi:Amt family ammonium transporter
MPLVVLGTFILWFGWYGFNCGSTLGLSDAKTGLLAAQVAMNTTISASIGGITVFVIKFALIRKYDIGALCNGILAGLVSITAGCGNVECGTAWAIGLLGGFVYVGASELMRQIKVDDPLDAFAVHGACGAWGVLAAALFDWGKGFDFAHGWSGFDCVAADGKCVSGAGGEIIAANIVEIVAIASWVAILSLAIFIPLRLAGLLVATVETQEIGMDAAKHSPTKAYGNM